MNFAPQPNTDTDCPSLNVACQAQQERRPSTESEVGEQRHSHSTMESRLLALLKTRFVTPLDALHEVGCLSLSQRAGQFARQGHNVIKQRVSLPNGKSVMSYRVQP